MILIIDLNGLALKLGNLNYFHVCFVYCRCHDLHENLLLSIHSTLKAGGIALITFSHHIPGLELQDLSFFEKAKKMGFQSKFIKTFTGQAMWSDKMVQLYLYSLEKP
uniref:Uncharacterized protein n=1 Tax=Aplanochytrium stocchinoi TaxID=215587 RepID=A0A6S8BUZ9_9STRA|mmetsp:Transcript_2793/g.3543  ORF Transcript_2793/g.3543 Transcript_2793/m.3543 type:complete len:107 (-) Transcript_2793:838-1158(-)